MPTSYPDLNAKDLVRIKSYPVREWGDMIWAYMGPAGEIPDLPALEMALVPASHRYVSKKWQDCNWVQALEGSIDTAHFTFAHLSFEKEEDEVLDIKKHFVNPIARMKSTTCAGSPRTRAPSSGSSRMTPGSRSPVAGSPAATISTGASRNF